jgi:DNA invertase Pin-like site-specific DNA recombinase
VVGFARVSTREQANGYSLGAQRDVMDGWCDSAGAELVAVMIDVISSRKTERMHGWMAAIAAVAAGAADALLVRAVDRATRSTYDGALLLRECAEAAVRVVSVEGFDSADPDTEFTTNVRIAMAQEERRLISRRTREGLARAKAEGKTLGRPSQVPQEVAERIARDRSNGCTFREIAAALDADGIPTPGGSKSWRPATVADIYARNTNRTNETTESAA